jgi:hypothetical protein
LAMVNVLDEQAEVSRTLGRTTESLRATYSASVVDKV